MVVDTNSGDKLYNRAYLQTQLNSTDTSPVMRLLYSFDSMNATNTTLALEVINLQDNRILGSWILDDEPVNTRFPLPDIIGNIPVEFRIYVITENPGVYVLFSNGLSIE